MGVLGVAGLVLVVGVLFSRSQPQKSVESAPSSITQGLAEEPRADGSAPPSASDTTTSSSQRSSNFFVSEESELDTEMSGLQSDINQLGDQDSQTDLKNLDQVQ